MPYEKRVYSYHVGLDYIHIYDDGAHDNSGNPFASVYNEDDAILIVKALNA